MLIEPYAVTLDINTRSIFVKAALNGIVIDVSGSQSAIFLLAQTGLGSSICKSSETSRHGTNEAEEGLIELCLTTHEIEYLAYVLFEFLLPASQLWFALARYLCWQDRQYLFGRRYVLPLVGLNLQPKVWSECLMQPHEICVALAGAPRAPGAL